MATVPPNELELQGGLVSICNPTGGNISSASVLHPFSRPLYNMDQTTPPLGSGRDDLGAILLHQRVYHSDNILIPQSFPPPYTPTKEEDSLLPHPSVTSPSKAKFGTLAWRHNVSESPGLWLALYFVLNLTLTLYNKSVLIHFPFPYTLTAVHSLCGTIGTSVLLYMDKDPERWKLDDSYRIRKLNRQERIVLFLFSMLYTINIAVSNVSLKLVTVPFHQVVRASCPFFTIILTGGIIGTRSSRAKLIALIPVVAGVGFATYGDYYYTAYGFLLTLLGTILAAFKTVLTNVLQTSPLQSKSLSNSPPSLIRRLILFPKKLTNVFPAVPKLNLSPLHLLSLLSPLAFLQSLLLAYLSGELDRMHNHFRTNQLTTSSSNLLPIFSILTDGVVAFMLNVVSFNANRKVGPLGMSVAANVKQVLTILSAVVLFDLTITPTNALGIFLTFIGGVWYAQVDLSERSQKD